MPQPPALVLIGPPGAGKSTLSDRLVQRLPLTVIATGERLRAEIRSGSPLGRQIEPLLEQGHFAPDEVMEQLLYAWLAEAPPEQGFLLDGYPRSLSQAHTLSRLLDTLQRPLTMVIALELSDAEVIRRLTGRRVCEGGGESFTLHIDDAAAVQRCHERGGRLVERDDDRPEIIAERLRVYARETEPLLALYRQRGLLRLVDAHGTPDDAAARVFTLLGQA